MWLQTTRGFISAVEWHGGEHDGKIVLRSRTREHLEAVLQLTGKATEIAVSPHADYRYRAWIPREGFEGLIVALSREVIYSNFKGAVEHKSGTGRYATCLHQTWSILGRMQPRGPYGTGGKSYPKVPQGEHAVQRKADKEPVDNVRHLRPLACHDCGHVGDLDDFAAADGEYYCRDIGACLARSDHRRG